MPVYRRGGKPTASRMVYVVNLSILFRTFKTHIWIATGGHSMALHAVIDIGTNSVKCHIGEQNSLGEWKVVSERAVITRLGEGLRTTGELSPVAMERTFAALDRMVGDAQRSGAVDITAVGTMALRTARNSATFLEQAGTRYNLSVTVLSGEEESRLSYRAARSTLPDRDQAAVVFDTGGGSTEFVFGQGSAITESFSVNIGALGLTEDFGMAGTMSPAQLDGARTAIADELRRLDTAPPVPVLVGVGGTITTLAAVHKGLRTFSPGAVQGALLDRGELSRQIALYATHSAEERRTIAGLPPGRADIILAGACIVGVVMEKLRHERLIVSERGLRHGVLMDRFGN